MNWLRQPLFHRPGAVGLPLLAAVTMSGSLPMHAIVPTLPAAAAELAVSPATIQLTITLYLVGLAIGQLVHGPLSDRFGRRPVLVIGLAVYTAAAAAAALAPTVGLLIAARVLQALGGCAGLVLGRAIVRDRAGPDRAAARLALLILFMLVAPALAPALGGYIALWFGWRAVFGLLAVLGAATLVVVVLVLPETNAARSALAGPADVLLSYLRLLRSAPLTGYAVGGACSTTSFYAFMAASPFLFIDVLHRPAEEVGLYYLGLLLGVAAGSLTASRLAGRVRVARAVCWSNLVSLAAAAALLAASLADQVGVPMLVGCMFVFMLGAGITSPFALTACMSVFPTAVGAASGVYGFAQMVYGALCTVAVGLWHAHSTLPVAVILLVSTILGQAALGFAARAAPDRE